jgi:ribosomal protein S18 acetylase RimI-like enzyme
MHIESPALYSRPTQLDVEDMTVFFAEQMELTREQWYTSEDIEWNIHEHHTRDQFERYIYDTQIYLEIVRDKWEIVGYIEARMHQEDSSRIHIWWVIVSPEYRWGWIAKNLYHNLEKHMRKYGYKKLTASTKKENSISLWFHLSQW